MPTVVYVPGSSLHSRSGPTDALTQVRVADEDVGGTLATDGGAAVADAPGIGDVSRDGGTSADGPLDPPPAHAPMIPMHPTISHRDKRIDMVIVTPLLPQGHAAFASDFGPKLPALIVPRQDPNLRARRQARIADPWSPLSIVFSALPGPAISRRVG